MADRSLLRRIYVHSQHFEAVLGSGGCTKLLNSNSFDLLCRYATTKATDDETNVDKTKEMKKDKWYTLPPFKPTITGAALGKAIADRRYKSVNMTTAAADTTMTALKWVLHCCPDLPRSLVQKLFRLRQVRRESSDVGEDERKLKRVVAKDTMKIGDRICLPITVENTPHVEADEFVHNEEEMKFLRGIELYKDSAIIVINKPPGLPVQGGIGIKRSLDELAAKYLRYGFQENPRLVHRLDRQCSGVLVMGRTQLSASVLHSIFREKTSGAPIDDRRVKGEVMRKKYWALVIGSPRRSRGLISVPLGKVIVDDGKSERVTVMDNIESSVAQYAVTEYRVIGSSSHGYTWLELCPITGRKHQLRVHCAEVLGTPIVGDYKYGWQAHRNLEPLSCFIDARNPLEKSRKAVLDPFGLDLESGSLSDKQVRLHLHCKELVLPNISSSLQHGELDSDRMLAELKLDAPLPSHMQKSWDILNS